MQTRKYSPRKRQNMWGSVGDRHAQASTFGKPFFFFLSHTDKEIIQKKKSWEGGKGGSRRRERVGKRWCRSG